MVEAFHQDIRVTCAIWPSRTRCVGSFRPASRAHRHRRPLVQRAVDRVRRGADGPAGSLVRRRRRAGRARPSSSGAGSEPPPVDRRRTGRSRSGPPSTPVDLDEIVDATDLPGAAGSPIDGGDRSGDGLHPGRDRSQRSPRSTRRCSPASTAALVTSHVDYNHWGLAVETATRFGVPVIHMQSTGA